MSKALLDLGLVNVEKAGIHDPNALDAKRRTTKKIIDYLDGVKSPENYGLITLQKKTPGRSRNIVNLIKFHTHFHKTFKEEKSPDPKHYVDQARRKSYSTKRTAKTARRPRTTNNFYKDSPSQNTLSLNKLQKVFKDCHKLQQTTLKSARTLDKSKKKLVKQFTQLKVKSEMPQFDFNKKYKKKALRNFRKEKTAFVYGNDLRGRYLDHQLQDILKK